MEPWIEAKPDDGNSNEWKNWRDVGCRALARSLPTELYQERGACRVALAGQPTRRLDLGDAGHREGLFEALQSAASWVYLEGPDVEIRHTFLNGELARDWPQDLSFLDGLAGRVPSALDSARLLYRAHLRSGSKDTIKALADLRKTLAEEVGKVAAQTRDLASGIWRDAALAIGVVALRFGLDAAKAGTSSTSFATIFALVSLYIGFSHWMSLSINRRFLRSIESSRPIWRTKLYGFLDDSDYRALAEVPLADATQIYEATRRRTTAVVAIIVLSLFAGAALGAGLTSKMVSETIVPLATGSWEWAKATAETAWTSLTARKQ